MKNINTVAIVLLVFAGGLSLPGCGQPEGRRGKGGDDGRWTVAKTATIDSVEHPESVGVDPETGSAYISNMAAPNSTYWKKDGKAFISKLSPGGEVEKLRWVDSSPGALLHCPKGSCIVDGVLYVADCDRIVRIRLENGEMLEPIDIPDAQRLNDMASDETAAWVSDTGTGKVWKLADGEPVEIKAPEAVNGLVFRGGKMFAVSWALHEVFELDPTGKKPPEPFGVASHFQSLDAIDVLDDGTYIVSDFIAGAICTISADRRDVETIVQLETPADFGFDRERSLLYVPQPSTSTVTIYRLKKK